MRNVHCRFASRQDTPSAMQTLTRCQTLMWRHDIWIEKYQRDEIRVSKEMGDLPARAQAQPLLRSIFG